MYLKSKFSILFVSVIILSILNFNSIFSQNSVIVLLKGKVLEDKTNAPIGTRLRLIGADGTLKMFSSNKSDGEYQQPLNANTTYWAVLENYVVANGKNFFTTSNTKEYIDIDYNFIVKKIDVNTDLYQLNLFKPNDSVVSNSDTRQLKELKEWMHLNKKVNLRIVINTYDSHSQSKDVSKTATKDKSKQKGKSKSTTVATPVVDPIQSLANARVEAVKKYLQSNEISPNLFKFSVKIGTAKQKADTQSKTKSKSKKKAPQTITETPAQNTDNDFDVLIQVDKILNM